MRTEQPQTPSPRNVLPDLIIPALALGFTIYYLTTITEVPWISQASAVFVSTLLALAIVAFAIRTTHRLRRGIEVMRWRGVLSDGPTQLKRVLLLALTVVYVFGLEPLGFTLMTFLFIFSGIVLLSSPANWKRALIASACCSLGGYLVFVVVFQTRFPKGLFENLMAGLVRGGA